MKYTKKKPQPTMPCEFFYSASFDSTMKDSKYLKNQCNTILFNVPRTI